MAENEVQQEQTQEQEAATITIQDLDLAGRVIGAGIERGAFKAAEAEDVGRLWKKITAFVQSAAAQLEAQQAEGGAGQEAGE